MNLALAQRSTRLIPSLFPLEYMVEEAVEFLREHEPAEGYFVGFSGGKDSIVTLELCRMAGVKHEAFYSATGIDAPEVVRFIRKHYPSVTWLYPKMTFWEGIKKKSPPLCTQRWCCDVLKKDPSKHIPLKHRVMGIRAEESMGRAERGRISICTIRKGRGKNKKGQLLHTHLHPIFHWQEWHVWEFIDAKGLPYPCLYDEGFDRIGCIVCPFILHKNQTKLNRQKARWPAMYRVFEKVVADWYLNHSTKDRYSEETPEEYLEAYYRGFE